MINNSLNESPILTLEGNILWQFENLSKHGVSKLRLEVKQGLISREIDLRMDAAPPSGPHLKQNSNGTPTIDLQVSFLELIWAFIYSWMIIYEEECQRPQLPGTELPTGPTPDSLIPRAHKLLQWAKTLAHHYSYWPVDLPSPKLHANSAEQYFSEKANHVFQLSVAFLLSHERAHALYDHLSAIKNRDCTDPIRKELEKEADIFALNGLIDPSTSDEEKSAKSWAILSAALSSFYLKKDPINALRSSSHPALHHRVAHFIRSLNFKDDRYRYYFPLLCRLVFQDLFPETLTPTTQFEDAEDALTDALDKLDELVGHRNAGS